MKACCRKGRQSDKYSVRGDNTHGFLPVASSPFVVFIKRWNVFTRYRPACCCKISFVPNQVQYISIIIIIIIIIIITMRIRVVED